ncbi:MAG: hypothetical protein JXA15_08890 [Spirochaetales bacterium]|nr:hypothetical protein [Spirochaetales bacterium]
MEFRPGAEGDLPGVLRLQELNLVTNLGEEERKDGFVTTPFTIDQLRALVAAGGLFVAARDGAVAGYAMAAGWEYWAGRPMFDLMIRRFEGRSCSGVRIDRVNSYQYGPICVARDERGKGVFLPLFEAARAGMVERFAVGTTFINKANPRSFRAHTAKARLEPIDEFEFGGQSFWGLAFPTARPS